jgi:hypothetical protein
MTRTKWPCRKRTVHEDRVDPGREEDSVEQVGLQLGALRDRAADYRSRRRRELRAQAATVGYDRLL